MSSKVPFLWRCKLSRAAKREATGNYGGILRAYEVAIRKSEPCPFILSRYTQRLIDEFFSVCKRKEYWNRIFFVNRSYSKIFRQHAEHQKYKNKITDKELKRDVTTAETDKKVADLKSELKNLHDVKQTAKTSGFKVEMGFSHYGALSAKIKELASEIDYLETEKSRKVAESEKENQPNDYQKCKTKDPFYKLISTFVKHLKFFDTEIDYVFNKYNDAWKFYFFKLCENCDVNIPSISFEEICSLYISSNQAIHSRYDISRLPKFVLDDFKKLFFSEEQTKVEKIISSLELEITEIERG